jgi:hypothetical protein
MIKLYVLVASLSNLSYFFQIGRNSAAAHAAEDLIKGDGSLAVFAQTKIIYRQEAFPDET